VTLWWVGNAVLLVAVVPGVVALLRGVLEAAWIVRRSVDELAKVGEVMVIDLAAVPELSKTERYVGRTTDGLDRYGAALQEIL